MALNRGHDILKLDSNKETGCDREEWGESDWTVKIG